MINWTSKFFVILTRLLSITCQSASSGSRFKTMTIYRTIHTVSFAAALLICASSVAEAADIITLLPKDSEIAGWKWKEKPRKYVSQQLWQYIDGGADVYLDFAFRQVATVELENKGKQVTVDIYEMGSLDDAFGIYASEVSPSYNFISIGAEGYQSGSSLIFYQGNYYVKINAFSGDAGSKSALSQFAHVISQRIGANRKQPAVLGAFPKQGRIRHSETRAHAAFLGQQSMKGAFTADFTVQGRKMTAFILVTQSPASAAARVKQIKNTLSAQGSFDAAVAGLGVSSYATGRLSTVRELLVAAQGKVVFGVYPAASMKSAEDLMRSLLNGLKGAALVK
jgi:hypothetical protein